uniref:COMM domain-containing protein n=1 Tax=Euplotes crassus TaxID=5936 RepID=A0A7S3NSA6_EUPCR
MDPKDFQEFSDQVVSYILNKIQIKSSSKQDSINALTCIILHLAKIKAGQKELDHLFPQMGLPDEFKETFLLVILPAIPEIREMVDLAEDENYNKFVDVKWRLGMTVSTRMKHKMMAPKYTIKLAMEDNEGHAKNYLIDSDYANMVRLRDELQEALKTLDTPMCKSLFYSDK